MRALILEHDHCSPPGPIAERLVERGYSIQEFVVVPGDRYQDPNVSVSLPDLTGYDVVVALGAPWSVYDLDRIGSWIEPELAALKATHDAGVPLLGICFGGQAVAAALGGSVHLAERAEIGWTTLETAGRAVIEAGPWFQLHYDRFEIPPGATLLASNELCPQAFQLGRTLGVQFHPEITGAALQLWYGNESEAEVREVGLDPAALLSETYAQDAAGRERAHRLVDVFLALDPAAGG
jgi:GMP synthase-like glutamine amidotransferase